MREFVTNITESFRKGLRQDARFNRNNNSLIVATNVRATQAGLEGFNPPTPMFDSGIPMTYPDVQVFHGDEYTIYADSTNLYYVDTSGAVWTRSAITTYDYLNRSATKSITAGGVWHFVDLKTKWFLFNGTCIVTNVDLNGIKGETDKVYVIDTITVNTGCHFKGRFIFGGFNPADFWGEDWDYVLSDLRNNVSESYTIATDDVKDNWVAWCSIGTTDFFEALVKATYGMYGATTDSMDSLMNYKLTDFDLVDLIRRGEWGFMPLPCQGAVQNIQALGNTVMVYTDDAVIELFPYQGDELVAPTFGVRKMSNLGITSRSSVGSNGSENLMLAKTGSLYSVTTEGATKLDYKEFFLNTINTTHFISYDADEEQFYISDNTRGYLLNRNGLTTIPQRITSLVHTNGEVRGVYTEHGDNDVIIGTIVTVPFDMQVSAIKTLTNIMLNYYNGGTVTIAIDYKYKTDEVWQTTLFKAVNKEGNVRMQVAGTEFRLRIQLTDITEFQLDSIDVRYQVTDKRFIRGAYADSSYAGASK